MTPTLIEDVSRLAQAELSRARVTARGAAIRSAGLGVAMVFVLAATGVLAFAGYHALVPAFGVPGAAAIVAAVLAGLGGVIALSAVFVVNRAAERRARAEALRAHAMLSGDVAKLVGGMRGLGDTSPMLLAAAALAAGLAVGSATGDD